MCRKFLLFAFLIIVSKNLYSFSPGPSVQQFPVFNESSRDRISGRAYFIINSSKIIYHGIPILCSVKSDCQGDAAKYSPGSTPKLLMEVTNHSSDIEKKLMFDARKAANPGRPYGSKPQKPTVIYSMDLKVHFRNDVPAALDYFLKNKNNYHMSDWLKSIKCKSMNFVALVKNPKLAKITTEARFERKDGKLYLLIDPYSKKSRKVEVDESTGEMNYLTSSQFSATFTLRTMQNLNFRNEKIPAINFCESFYSYGY